MKGPMTNNDYMPKGMDDDAFNEFEHQINRSIMEAEEKEELKQQELNDEWERHWETFDFMKD